MIEGKRERREAEKSWCGHSRPVAPVGRPWMALKQVLLETGKHTLTVWAVHTVG